MSKAIGIDIGGTKCAVSMGEMQDDKLKVFKRKEIPTLGTPFEILKQLACIAGEMIAEFGVPQCCGIVCGGPLDSKKGLILSPPNLPGWDTIDAVSFFKDKLGVPAHLVNDADAGALAEWQFGAGVGSENMIFITFGTGCGSGLILGGRLYSGSCDAAGECGHIRLSAFGPVGYGKAGSMEGFCSGSGIAQLGALLARERLQMGKKCGYCGSLQELESITAKDIAAAANNGDQTALEVFRISGEHLGKGLSVLVDLLNPQIIILGGIFFRCRDLLWEHANAVMKKECLSASLEAVQVLPAGLGEQIGDFAALSAAFYNVNNHG